MNVATVGVLALLLAVPAVLGFAGGSIDPDEVGLRVLMAVAAAVVAEVVLRRFVDAVRRPDEQPVLARREGDPPAA